MGEMPCNSFGMSEWFLYNGIVMEEENLQVESEKEQVHEKSQQKQQEHKTLNHHSLYYSFIERYFKTYRTPNQYLHQHSNGLFVIRVRTDTLPAPPLQIRPILNVQQVKGKKKRGGTKVSKDTVIVQIVCQNGFVLPVRALVDGIILERNERLIPTMLERPEGYVAVINPSKKFRPRPDEMEEVMLAHQQ